MVGLLAIELEQLAEEVSDGPEALGLFEQPIEGMDEGRL